MHVIPFQGVMLDVCSLDHELTLLQQGCDLTGGNYLKIPQQNGQPPLAGLLQYLLVCHIIYAFIVQFISHILCYNLFDLYILVGFPARSCCQVKVSITTTCQSGLSRSLFLSSGIG